MRSPDTESKISYEVLGLSIKCILKRLAAVYAGVRRCAQEFRVTLLVTGTS